MGTVVKYEESAYHSQKKIMLNQHVLRLVREYCMLSTQQGLSASDADRLCEILTIAEKNSCLDFWINEADHFMDHELGLITGKTIYPVETENQKATLLEHLDFWSQENGVVGQSSEAAELIAEIQDFLCSGASEVQVQLKNKGFDPGPIDGVAGLKTHSAIISFQKAHNLAVSGRLDPDTQLALGCH